MAKIKIIRSLKLVTRGPLVLLLFANKSHKNACEKSNNFLCHANLGFNNSRGYRKLSREGEEAN